MTSQPPKTGEQGRSKGDLLLALSRTVFKGIFVSCFLLAWMALSFGIVISIGMAAS